MPIFPTLARRAVGRSALLAATTALLALPASRAAAQGSTADSLAGLLSTADVHQRALAVARLNALPLAELTPGARSALVELLDAEATRRAPIDADAIGAEDEIYAEYL